MSISFVVQPQQPPLVEETVNQPDPAPVLVRPLLTHQAHRTEQRVRILKPPPHPTA